MAGRNTVNTPIQDPTPGPGLAPGSPEYDAEMARRAESGMPANEQGNTEGLAPTTTPVTGAAMPEGGQEKFWNAETRVYNWEGHAKAVEFASKQSATDKAAAAAATPEATPKPETTPELGNADLEVKKATEIVAQAGLDLPALQQEWNETGVLSAETYTALEGQGYDKAIVDSFIEGQKALATLTRNSVFEAAGGQEAYEAMTLWASEGLTPAEIAEFNASVNSGNSARVDMAVRDLTTRYGAAEGQPPATQVQGDTQSGVAAGDTYGSWTAVQKDMSDPRYNSSNPDPAFIAMVEAKLGRSNI